jgi:hypothetical protein
MNRSVHLTIVTRQPEHTIEINIKRDNSLKDVSYYLALTYTHT